MQTHYEMFGVAENAPAETIRAAWKRLMKQHHPDANPGADPQIAVRINQVFDVLKDPHKRAAYDRELAAARQPVLNYDAVRELYRQMQNAQASYTGQQTGTGSTVLGGIGGGIFGNVRFWF